MKKRQYCLTISTTNNLDEAQRIANHLVSNHLVACVNLIPGIQSIYRWENKVASDSEILMLMKTTNSMVPHVKKAIAELHSYDTPELIVLPIRAGMKRYLQWIKSSVSKRKRL